MKIDPEAVFAAAKECFQIESEALMATADSLDNTFVRIIEAIHETVLRERKIIFSGMGKNRFICQKIVGTFNSTGVPSSFLDPVDALHGDMGLCVEGDLVFLVSHSGETDEIVKALIPFKRLKVTTVAVTGNPDSELVRNTDLQLIFKVPREACPLNLAPTASTTATLALGDALAMTYLKLRNFSTRDFARYHPAGIIGQSLLLLVEEAMRKDDRFAQMPTTATVKETIMAITKARCGTAAITEPETGVLAGVFSDGDFRRTAITAGPGFLDLPVFQFMTRDPKTIRSGSLAVDALRAFERWKINDLIVVDAKNQPIGIIDGQDLPRLKIV